MPKGRPGVELLLVTPPEKLAAALGPDARYVRELLDAAIARAVVVADEQLPTMPEEDRLRRLEWLLADVIAFRFAEVFRGRFRPPAQPQPGAPGWNRFGV